MLEYAVYKHLKNKRSEKARENQSSTGAKENDDLPDEAPPILNHDEEAFLATLIDDDEHRPPLPPRVRTPQLFAHSSDDEPTSPVPAPAPASPKKSRLPAFLFAERPATDADDEAKSRRARVAALFRKSVDSIRTETSTALTLYMPQTAAAAAEAATEAGVDKEQDDLNSVLKDLNMGAKGNKAFSLSHESGELMHKFNQVLRDLIEGGPTAYNDLTHLLDDRDNVLGRAYDKLPSSMKHMVESLPEKITASLGPEVLVAAAEAAGIKIALDSSQVKSGKKGAAKKAIKSGAMSLLTPGNLQKLITKPGALVSMLKAIVAALKTRWPIFISTNILFSVAVFLLLFVLWYCHKRGREQRLERENRVDGSGRIEEIVEWEIEEVQDDDDDDNAPGRKQPLLLGPPNPASPKGADSPRSPREQARRSPIAPRAESGGSGSLEPRRRRRRREHTDDDESDREREGERERQRERERARYHGEKDRGGEDDRPRDGDRRRMNTDMDMDRGRDRDREYDYERGRDSPGKDERRRRRRARHQDHDDDGDDSRDRDRSQDGGSGKGHGIRS